MYFFTKKILFRFIVVVGISYAFLFFTETYADHLKHTKAEYYQLNFSFANDYDIGQVSLAALFKVPLEQDRCELIKKLRCLSSAQLHSQLGVYDSFAVGDRSKVDRLNMTVSNPSVRNILLSKGAKGRHVGACEIKPAPILSVGLTASEVKSVKLQASCLCEEEKSYVDSVEDIETILKKVDCSDFITKDSTGNLELGDGLVLGKVLPGIQAIDLVSRKYRSASNIPISIRNIELLDYTVNHIRNGKRVFQNPYEISLEYRNDYVHRDKQLFNYFHLPGDNDKCKLIKKLRCLTSAKMNNTVTAIDRFSTTLLGREAELYSVVKDPMIRDIVVKNQTDLQCRIRPNGADLSALDYSFYYAKAKTQKAIIHEKACLCEDEFAEVNTLEDLDFLIKGASCEFGSETTLSQMFGELDSGQLGSDIRDSSISIRKQD